MEEDLWGRYAQQKLDIKWLEMLFGMDVSFHGFKEKLEKFVFGAGIDDLLSFWSLGMPHSVLQPLIRILEPPTWMTNTKSFFPYTNQFATSTWSTITGEIGIWIFLSKKSIFLLLTSSALTNPEATCMCFFGWKHHQETIQICELSYHCTLQGQDLEEISSLHGLLNPNISK